MGPDRQLLPQSEQLRGERAEGRGETAQLPEGRSITKRTDVTKRRRVSEQREKVGLNICGYSSEEAAVKNYFCQL